MISGPYYFFECPNCGCQLKKASFATANTFGAQLYSDLKRLAPNYPEYPLITRCKNCLQLFWLETNNLVNESFDELYSIYKKKKVENAEFLELYEYFEALEMQLAKSIEEEVYLRKCIHWCFNDRVRNGNEIFESKADIIIWRLNTNRLLEMLDYDDLEERILMAELNRSMGNFIICREIIESIDSADYEWLKDNYIDQCFMGNKKVFLLY